MKKKAKPQFSERKSPKQARSKNIVDAVMESSAHIFANLGYEKTTTNRIAEKAGISIGSLYQYFPNKDSIFAKIIEKTLSEHRIIIIDELKKRKSESLPQVIDAIISLLVDVFIDKKKFLQLLFVHIPRLEKTRDLLFNRNAVVQDLKAHILEFHNEEIQVENLEETMFVITNAIMGVVYTAILSDETLISPTNLKDQLALMVKRTLGVDF